MRTTLALFSRLPLISIRNGTFFREHPSAVADQVRNPSLFPNLNFELQAPTRKPVGRPSTKTKSTDSDSQEHWAVISAKGGTSLLEVLRGSHFCEPLGARTYPYLDSDEISEHHRALRLPSQAIHYVGFNPGQGSSGMGAGIQGAYLSARYESRRLTAEETDWTVRQYLKGQTTLNPSEEDEESVIADDSVNRVVSDLRLQKLLDMPVSNLSNGQTRRSRIAKALLGKPLLLLLDDPFMGLDPPTLMKLSPMLRDLANTSSPMLLLSLRLQDPIPDWITHLVVLADDQTVLLRGRKEDVILTHQIWLNWHGRTTEGYVGFGKALTRKLTEAFGAPPQGMNESLTDQGVVQRGTYRRIHRNRHRWRGKLSPHKDMPEEIQDRLRKLQATQTAPLEHSLEELQFLVPEMYEMRKTNRSGDTQQMAENSESIQDTNPEQRLGSPLVELESVVVKYGDKIVLGHAPPQPGYEAPGLNMTIREGTRLALIGPNGSGKTTFLSLLTSDHPQSYSLPIKFFGRSRLPEPGRPGLSLWEIQSRIGHSAPEVHAFFPKNLSVRQVLESAWAETYVSKPKLTYDRDEMVNAFLRWWEPELHQGLAPTIYQGTNTFRRTIVNRGIYDLLYFAYPPVVRGPGPSLLHHWMGIADQVQSLDWAEDTSKHRFGVLPFGVQRLLLLLRAIIKQPDILILDEAFSGLSRFVREKAMLFLECGETRFVLDSPDLALVRSSMKPTKLPEGALSHENTRIDVERLFYSRRIEVESRPTLPHSLADVRGLRDKTVEELKVQGREHVELNKVDVSTAGGLEDYRFKGLSDKQAMIVVSHLKEEVPEMCDEYVRLPGEEEVLEDSRPVEIGYVGRGGISKKWGWLWQSRKDPVLEVPTVEPVETTKRVPKSAKITKRVPKSAKTTTRANATNARLATEMAKLAKMLQPTKTEKPAKATTARLVKKMANLAKLLELAKTPKPAKPTKKKAKSTTETAESTSVPGESAMETAEATTATSEPPTETAESPTATTESTTETTAASTTKAADSTTGTAN